MNNIISKKFYMELSVNDNKVYNNKELYCKLNDSIKLYVKLKEDGVIRDLTKYMRIMNMMNIILM